MEEPLFLNIQKSYSIIFSWKGSLRSKESIGHQITGQDKTYSLSWKRDSKQYPYPLQIKFTTQLVKYDCDSILRKGQNDIRHFNSIPFIHLFFVDCSSAEEYKQTVRHQISEWFSYLSNIDKAQWLIVFDSKSARESKNRNGVYEKIKSDFSGHMSHLVDVHDAPTMLTLETSISQSLLAAIDVYATNVETLLHEYRLQYKTSQFNLLQYSDGFFTLMHFYWSLSLLEVVLSQLDDQRAFLDTIINAYIHDQNSLPWSDDVKEYKEFTLLSNLMASQTSNGANNVTRIIYLRKYILAQQIMTSFAIYFERTKRAINSDVNANLERLAILKVDISSMILKSVFETILKIKNDIYHLNLTVDTLAYEVWIVLIILECFEFATILTPQMFNKDLGANNICCLLRMKCNSIVQSWKLLQQKKFTLSITDLDHFPINGPFFGNEVNLLSKFKECLTNKSDFQLYFESTFAEAITEMKNLNYFRSASLARLQLADFINETGNPERSLALKIDILKSMMYQEKNQTTSISIMVDHLIHSIVQQKKEALFHEELMLFCTYGLHFMKNKRNYHTIIFDTLITKQLKLPTWLEKKQLMVIKTNSYQNTCLNCVTGQTKQFEFDIHSSIPATVSGVKINAIFRLLKKEDLATLVKSRPLFLAKYNAEESVNRLGCLHKGGFSDSKRLGIPDDVIEFEVTLKSDTISPGGNNPCSLQYTFHQTGLYLFDSTEIVFPNGIIVNLNYSEMLYNESDVFKPLFRNIFCLVDDVQPYVNLKQNHHFENVLAGVVQTIQMTLTCGSKDMGPTTLQIGPKMIQDERLEFCGSDGLWNNNVAINVPELKANQTIVVDIEVYLPTARLSFANWSDPPLCKKVEVKWCQNVYMFTIEFIPILNVVTTTSIMDNKALFEMEIHRKHGKKLIIQPHDASFHVVDKENDSISIERLNKEIGENEAIGSVFSIVWLLENTTRGTSNLTNPLLRYRLKFKYKVFEKDDVDGCLKEISFDRGYQLVSEFNFAIPTVEYEICAQLLSELPQTVVCRSLNNCEMVLSIRSIINKVETIIVGVDGDKSLWHIPTQLKQLTIKESGLGQITFTVVPQCVGFLPYPNITLYIFDKEHGNPEKIKEAIEPHSSVIGKQICIFSRTKGKQIHVLGQQISGANDNVSHNSSRHLKDENHSSSRSSLRDSAKQKLQKFFDK